MWLKRSNADVEIDRPRVVDDTVGGSQQLVIIVGSVMGSPTSHSDKKLVDALMSVYGARDIFMGLDIYSAVYFRDRKSLGWILIAASGVAFWLSVGLRLERESGITGGMHRSSPRSELCCEASSI
jgi:hypothetical protein